MRITDAGARAVWPKILKCCNCGSQVEVDSFVDLSRHMPGFAWVANAMPGAFQFACPNVCGSFYFAVSYVSRQAFYHAPCVSYGGLDATEIRPGALQAAAPTKPRRRRRRPGGESHGTVPASR